MLHNNGQESHWIKLTLCTIGGLNLNLQVGMGLCLWSTFHSCSIEISPAPISTSIAHTGDLSCVTFNGLFAYPAVFFGVHTHTHTHTCMFTLQGTAPVLCWCIHTYVWYMCTYLLTYVHMLLQNMWYLTPYSVGRFLTKTQESSAPKHTYRCSVHRRMYIPPPTPPPPLQWFSLPIISTSL
jgi:hypothetical protein